MVKNLKIILKEGSRGIIRDWIDPWFMTYDDMSKKRFRVPIQYEEDSEIEITWVSLIDIEKVVSN